MKVKSKNDRLGVASMTTSIACREAKMVCVFFVSTLSLLCMLTFNPVSQAGELTASSSKTTYHQPTSAKDGMTLADQFYTSGDKAGAASIYLETYQYYSNDIARNDLIKIAPRIFEAGTAGKSPLAPLIFNALMDKSSFVPGQRDEVVNLIKTIGVEKVGTGFATTFSQQYGVSLVPPAPANPTKLPAMQPSTPQVLQTGTVNVSPSLAPVLAKANEEYAHGNREEAAVDYKAIIDQSIVTGTFDPVTRIASTRINLDKATLNTIGLRMLEGANDSSIRDTAKMAFQQLVQDAPDRAGKDQILDSLYKEGQSYMAVELYKTVILPFVINGVQKSQDAALNQVGLALRNAQDAYYAATAAARAPANMPKNPDNPTPTEIARLQQLDAAANSLLPRVTELSNQYRDLQNAAKNEGNSQLSSTLKGEGDRMYAANKTGEAAVAYYNVLIMKGGGPAALGGGTEILERLYKGGMTDIAVEAYATSLADRGYGKEVAQIQYQNGSVNWENTYRLYVIPKLSVEQAIADIKNLQSKGMSDMANIALEWAFQQAGSEGGKSDTLKQIGVLALQLSNRDIGERALIAAVKNTAGDSFYQASRQAVLGDLRSQGVDEATLKVIAGKVGVSVPPAESRPPTQPPVIVYPQAIIDEAKRLDSLSGTELAQARSRLNEWTKDKNVDYFVTEGEKLFNAGEPGAAEFFVNQAYNILTLMQPSPGTVVTSARGPADYVAACKKVGELMIKMSSPNARAPLMLATYVLNATGDKEGLGEIKTLFQENLPNNSNDLLYLDQLIKGPSAPSAPTTQTPTVAIPPYYGGTVRFSGFSLPITISNGEKISEPISFNNGVKIGGAYDLQNAKIGNPVFDDSGNLKSITFQGTIQYGSVPITVKFNYSNGKVIQIIEDQGKAGDVWEIVTAVDEFGREKIVGNQTHLINGNIGDVTRQIITTPIPSGVSVPSPTPTPTPSPTPPMGPTDPGAGPTAPPTGPGPSTPPVGPGFIPPDVGPGYIPPGTGSSGGTTPPAGVGNNPHQDVISDIVLLKARFKAGNPPTNVIRQKVNVYSALDAAMDLNTEGDKTSAARGYAAAVESGVDQISTEELQKIAPQIYDAGADNVATARKAFLALLQRATDQTQRDQVFQLIQKSNVQQKDPEGYRLLLVGKTSDSQQVTPEQDVQNKLNSAKTFASTGNKEMAIGFYKYALSTLQANPGEIRPDKIKGIIDGIGVLDAQEKATTLGSVLAQLRNPSTATAWGYKASDLLVLVNAYQATLPPGSQYAGYDWVKQMAQREGDSETLSRVGGKLPPPDPNAYRYTANWMGLSSQLADLSRNKNQITPEKIIPVFSAMAKVNGEDAQAQAMWFLEDLGKQENTTAWGFKAKDVATIATIEQQIAGPETGIGTWDIAKAMAQKEGDIATLKLVVNAYNRTGNPDAQDVMNFINTLEARNATANLPLTGQALADRVNVLRDQKNVVGITAIGDQLASAGNKMDALMAYKIAALAYTDQVHSGGNLSSSDMAKITNICSKIMAIGSVQGKDPKTIVTGILNNFWINIGGKSFTDDVNDELAKQAKMAGVNPMGWSTFGSLPVDASKDVNENNIGSLPFGPQPLPAPVPMPEPKSVLIKAIPTPVPQPAPIPDLVPTPEPKSSLPVKATPVLPPPTPIPTPVPVQPTMSQPLGFRAGDRVLQKMPMHDIAFVLGSDGKVTAHRQSRFFSPFRGMDVVGRNGDDVQAGTTVSDITTRNVQGPDGKTYVEITGFTETARIKVGDAIVERKVQVGSIAYDAQGFQRGNSPVVYVDTLNGKEIARTQGQLTEDEQFIGSVQPKLPETTPTQEVKAVVENQVVNGITFQITKMGDAPPQIQGPTDQKGVSFKEITSTVGSKGEILITGYTKEMQTQESVHPMKMLGVFFGGAAQVQRMISVEKVSNITYDDAGRMLSQRIERGSRNERGEKFSSSVNDYTYAYDMQGRVIKETEIWNPGQKMHNETTTVRTYAADGSFIAQESHRNYDSLGRLSMTSEWTLRNGTIREKIVSQTFYMDANGNVTKTDKFTQIYNKDGKGYYQITETFDANGKLLGTKTDEYGFKAPLPAIDVKPEIKPSVEPPDTRVPVPVKVTPIVDVKPEIKPAVEPPDTRIPVPVKEQPPVEKETPPSPPKNGAVIITATMPSDPPMRELALKSKAAAADPTITKTLYPMGSPFAGLVKEYSYAKVENGKALEVVRTDIQYVRQDDGTMKPESYSEEFKNPAGEVVRMVDKINITYKDSQENSFNEITSVKKNEQGDVDRTIRIVKDGKDDVKPQTITVDKNGNEIGKTKAAVKDQKDALALAMLRQINEASKNEPAVSATPGSMKKIAQKKFKEGMAVLEQQFVKLEASRNEEQEGQREMGRRIEEGQKIRSMQKEESQEKASRHKVEQGSENESLMKR